MSKPAGKVTVIDFIPGEANTLVARAKLVARDENGVLWEFHGAYMVSELQPYCAEQTQEFYQWYHAVGEHLSWTLRKDIHSDVMRGKAEAVYREGLSPKQAAERLNAECGYRG